MGTAGEFEKKIKKRWRHLHQKRDPPLPRSLTAAVWQWVTPVLSAQVAVWPCLCRPICLSSSSVCGQVWLEGSAWRPLVMLAWYPGHSGSQNYGQVVMGLSDSLGLKSHS